MTISPRSSDHRSPKRLRYSSDDVSEEEEEDDYSFSSEEDEEDDVVIAEAGCLMETIANESENVTRSVNNTPSSSSSSSPSVKLKSSDVLDCPTCCEPLKKPIYQCTNGHLACSPCVNKLKNRCPFCRSHIGDIRNRAMEKIIEASIVPCKNSVHGCKETTTYGNQSSSHEKLCAYIPCSCPLPNCNYTGSYTDLKSHARSSHSRDEDYLIPFALNQSLIFGIDLRKEKNVTVFQEEKDGDLIVVQGFKRSHGAYVTVSCISPLTPGLRSFSCSLAKLKEHATLRLGFMVKKIQKVGVQQEEEPKDGFLLIPSYMLTSDHLKMQICIGSEYKYIHI